MIEAYVCLPHDLFVAKFENTGLNLIHKYLSNRKKGTKINSSYSDWYDIVRDVPQGSILNPLLSNLFINNLFLFIERANFCNFPDNNIRYSYQNGLKTYWRT